MNRSFDSVDANTVEAFDRDGFVVVEGLLARDELVRYGNAVDRAVARRSQGDGRTLAEKSLYEQSFIQCMRLWEDDADVRPLTFHPRIGATAAALLGVDVVRLWQDQALYKESGGRETDAHQDLPFWPIREPHLVSAWIPFDGSIRAAGATGYVPGSHRTGLSRFVDITHLLHPEPYDILSDPAIAGVDPVWVEAPAGSVVFHHALTVHLAGPNLTDRTRRVFTIVYLADGCVRSNSRPVLSLERDGIGVGEKIAGPGLPVAWPRSEGDLPEPPTQLGPVTGFL
ncbi:phytanoyl-CoA dioxygenase family protein [Myxococcota bacterium]|nr:phytanoyl-CoA dioxygenase family protein [Myxococcota bacterium]